MGNSNCKSRDAQFSSKAKGRISLASGSGTLSPPSPPTESPRASPMSEEETVFNKHHCSGQISAVDTKLSTKKKYALIPDNFTTLEQVDLRNREAAT